MPLIKVQSSVVTPDAGVVEELLKSLSAKVAKHLGKPESYVMTSFEPDVKMSFAGTFEPACYIEVKSVGKMSSAQTKSMSQDFCQQVQDTLRVPKNRVYIEFNNSEGMMWGWNSTTFG
jgi:phenylpyruvate tautomerase PptA (4-oxalocrotonate tautomerase family)